MLNPSFMNQTENPRGTAGGVSGPDAPGNIPRFRRIIRQKGLLKRIYGEWYSRIVSSLPPVSGSVLELGSGGGFFKELFSSAITSDIMANPWVDLLLDGSRLPFAENRLRAVVMCDVFHHLPDPGVFLSESGRCVRPGGAVIMIEPWVSTWSRFVYGRLHHEHFDPRTPDWTFPAGRPLSAANSALPWIVFDRDRERFSREFPGWHIDAIEPGMPFTYLLSGGLSMPRLVPGWSFPLWRGAERMLLPLNGFLAMFAMIVLKRSE